MANFVTTVKREELIECIKKNMAEHQSIVEEAIAGYRKQVIKELEVALEAARQGKSFVPNISLVRPISHLKDYARVLKMLEMNTEGTVTLDEGQFSCYVMDRWSWKSNFLVSNSAYSMKASNYCEEEADD